MWPTSIDYLLISWVFSSSYSKSGSLGNPIICQRKKTFILFHPPPYGPTLRVHCSHFPKLLSEPIKEIWYLHAIKKTALTNYHCSNLRISNSKKIFRKHRNILWFWLRTKVSFAFIPSNTSTWTSPSALTADFREMLLSWVLWIFDYWKGSLHCSTFGKTSILN